jgi:DnaJ-domain-containing protein 1
MIKKPRGGRGKKANYTTTVIRVPDPVRRDVEHLIEQFHKANQKYCSQKITGEWWEILDVAPSASKDEVQSAFRKLAKTYHPDLNQRPDAQDRFQAIHDARSRYERQCL